MCVLDIFCNPIRLSITLNVLSGIVAVIMIVNASTVISTDIIDFEDHAALTAQVIDHERQVIWTLFLVNLVIGIFLLSISIFGFCAIKYLHKRWLIVYAGLMLGMFILHVACTCIFVMETQASTILNKIKIEIDKHETDKEMKDAMDKIHQKYKCCGFYSYTEFNDKIPASCCPHAESVCTEDNVYKEGCYISILEEVQKEIKSINDPIDYPMFALCGILIEVPASGLALYLYWLKSKIHENTSNG